MLQPGQCPEVITVAGMDCLRDKSGCFYLAGVCGFGDAGSWRRSGWQYAQAQHIPRPDSIQVFYLGIQCEQVFDCFSIAGVVPHTTKHALYNARKCVAVFYFVFVVIIHLKMQFMK